MVSSTVYGIEELLDRIYTLLTDYGYDVWMSHKGTLPVRSDRGHGDLQCPGSHPSSYPPGYPSGFEPRFIDEC